MKRVTLCLGLILSLVGFFSSPAMSYDDKTEITLKKAAVYAATYDATGKAASVTLLSYEGDDYVVVSDATSARLIPLVEHTVNVTGVVSIDAEGRNVITISTFEEAFN